MKVLIFGAGAIGSTIGGFLARAKEAQIHMLGRKEHIEAVKSRGLSITGLWGNFKVKNFTGLHTSPDTIKTSFDVVVVSVKAYSNPTIVDHLRKIICKTFVSFQNGVGNMEILAEKLNPEMVGGARVIFGSVFEKPGKVNITVYGGPILLGPYLRHSEGDTVKTLKKLAHVLKESGIPAKFVKDIHTPLWEKALYNCALNPLSAILKKTYGELADDLHARRIMEMVIHEGFEVAMRCGAKYYGNSDDFFKHFLDDMIPPTRGHISSMLQDIERRKRTEIDALNGAIVRFGREKGVRTPVNEVLTDIIKSVERQTLRLG
jgi:2-dehydropantoate 2-reductase